MLLPTGPTAPPLARPRTGGTRTCIHTPGQPMLPEEVTPELAASVLGGASLAYFDGRLTEAALVLAAAARERGAGGGRTFAAW